MDLFDMHLLHHECGPLAAGILLEGCVAVRRSNLKDARQWIKDGLVGKVTHIESWMSRNTPRGKGQWVRQIPSDCTAQNVQWDAFLNGRPRRSFDANQFINWRLFWDFSGGNVTENMVHQIAFVMRAMDLPLPTSAYMSGGVFSEKDGREVPDTIAVTLDFPVTSCLPGSRLSATAATA